MIGYKLFRFSLNDKEGFIMGKMDEWLKEIGDISITHMAQEQIADLLHMSIFYVMTESQVGMDFDTLEFSENELPTELTKAGIQARIDEINEGGTLLECYVQFKTLLQKVVNSMEVDHLKLEFPLT